MSKMRWLTIGIIPAIILTILFLSNNGNAVFQTSVSAQDKPTNPQARRELEQNTINSPAACNLSGTLGTAPVGGSTGSLTSRLNRLGAAFASKCGNNAIPTTVAGTNFVYNVHNIANTSSEPQCMTFTITTTSANNIELAAFKSPFVAADITNAARYLGDPGVSTGTTIGTITTFQTIVPPNTSIALVVFSTNDGIGTGATYNLDVTSTFGNGGGSVPCGIGIGLKSYTGPAVAIPDNNPTGISVNLPVTGIGRISAMSFRFETSGACDSTVGNTNAAVDHTFIGDLKFTLTSPSGKSILFQDRRGGTRENICSSLLRDVFNNPLISSLTSITGSPQAGNFQPEPTGRMSNFRGENADGVWTLNVSDNAGIDTGSLRRFSLQFDQFLFPESDFTNDGLTDISVFRPSNGGWYVNRSGLNTLYAVSFGQVGDKIVPADFTGDGATDVAVFRPSTNYWYVFDTTNNTFYGLPFGTSGDIPVPEDFDGDGKADINVFRPSTGQWYRNNSSDGAFVATPFGQNGDFPTVGNFDGDNKADIAVFRPSNGVWYRLNSKDNSFFAVAFGQSGDKVVPADYTADGKTDIAIWRPSNGTWYILRSEDLSFYGVPFGISTDVPAPGDYDGDGKADQAVFRSGQWYIQRSNLGFYSFPWGFATDTPTTSAYVY